MLVRRAIEPGYGLWVFPGGYVDRGEEVTAAAIREAREEAGLDIRLDSLVNIYSYPGRPLVVIVYAATRIGGDCAWTTSVLKRSGLLRPRSHGTSWRFRAPVKGFRTTWKAFAYRNDPGHASFATAVARTSSVSPCEIGGLALLYFLHSSCL